MVGFPPLIVVKQPIVQTYLSLSCDYITSLGYPDPRRKGLGPRLLLQGHVTYLSLSRDYLTGSCDLPLLVM